jgi:hypothetical protein
MVSEDSSMRCTRNCCHSPVVHGTRSIDIVICIWAGVAVMMGRGPRKGLSGSACAAMPLLLVLAACGVKSRDASSLAPQTVSPTQSRSTSPAATPSAAVRCKYLDSFEVALASNPKGEATPREALRRWLASSTMPGYTDAAGPWRQTFESTRQVNFTAGHATVHVVTLPSIGWIVEAAAAAHRLDRADGGIERASR